MKTRAFALLAALLALTLTIASVEVLFYFLKNYFPGLRPQMKAQVWKAVVPDGKWVLAPPLRTVATTKRSIPPRHVPEELDYSSKYPPGSWKESWEGYMDLNPGTYHSSIKRKSTGEILYDVQIGIDQYRRRMTTNSSSKKKSPFVFLGCSFIFGEGNNDSETLPSQMSGYFPKHQFYNYGMGGQSPGGLLVRLRNTRLSEQISEKEGVAVYAFIDDHFRRVFGHMSLVSQEWGNQLAYLTEDSSGQIHHEGDFFSGRKFQTGLYRAISKSQLIDFFRMDFPTLSQEHFRFFAQVVAEMKSELERQIGIRKFVVLLYPSTGGLGRELIPHLSEKGIVSLDLSSWKLDALTRSTSYIPYDGHPSPEGNRVLARHLAPEISSLLEE